VNLTISDCYLNMGGGYLRSSVHLSFRLLLFQIQAQCQRTTTLTVSAFSTSTFNKNSPPPPQKCSITVCALYHLIFRDKDESTLPPSHNMLSSITSTVGRKVNITKLFSTMTKLATINFSGASNPTARSIPAAQAVSSRGCPTCWS
jgi:hypothetical protein